MTRFLLSSVFAATLLAPVVASAQTPAAPATPAPAATPSPATPATSAPKSTARKSTMHHAVRHAAAAKTTKPTRQTATAAGDRAVEQLNDQSLARARAGGDSAPAAAPK